MLARVLRNDSICGIGSAVVLYSHVRPRPGGRAGDRSGSMGSKSSLAVPERPDSCDYFGIGEMPMWANDLIQARVGYCQINGGACGLGGPRVSATLGRRRWNRNNVASLDERLVQRSQVAESLQLRFVVLVVLTDLATAGNGRRQDDVLAVVHERFQDWEVVSSTGRAQDG